MKYFLGCLLLVCCYSCKKEERYNPDAHITYTHWYQLKSNANDTLFSVYIENCFTPNGDGVNDDFGPKGYMNLILFQVFNRDGSVAYETNNQYFRWQGKINADPNTCQEGAYAYKLNVTDAAGAEYEYSGHVMLYK